MRAKQPKVRNRTPDVRAKEPFELIHTDISGPIDPIAKDGFKYAIIFTDDCSDDMFTSTFILNVEDTPYGIITGKKPDVAKMQIFGSTCYPNVKNLDERSLMLVARKLFLLDMIEIVPVILSMILIHVL